MRICRVCLDDSDTLKPLLEDGDLAAVADLFFVCGIVVLESVEIPALVCPKCVIDIRNAAQLKRISLLADSFFRGHLTSFISQHFGSQLQLRTEVEPEIEAVDENLYEIVEYDDDATVIEALDEVECTSEEIVEPPTPKKPQSPRKSATPKQRYYQCDCGIAFSSQQRLRNHIIVKHEEIPEELLLPCLTCGKKFKLQEYLDLHIRNQHTEFANTQRQLLHPCSWCNKNLSSQTALKNHEQIHLLETIPNMAPPQAFICDSCGMEFRLKSYLYNHINNIHIRKKYQCPHCNRGYYKKYEMQDHIRQMHTFETPFVCDYENCTKKFARKKNLVIHQRIHTGDRPYPCTFENCGKSFMHFIDRKRHMMKHTGERPYCCLVEGCGKSFVRKTELENHSKIHF